MKVAAMAAWPLATAPSYMTVLSAPYRALMPATLPDASAPMYALMNCCATALASIWLQARGDGAQLFILKERDPGDRKPFSS